jgi:para-nitrobenzyl esterase
MTRQASDVVKTQDGAVRGDRLKDGGVLCFRGIPFAAPPVGNLRWKAPRPPAPWEGVRDCRKFGSIPVQHRVSLESLFPMREEPQSEDCLYLNVWTGSTDRAERRPAIVWFYLGAFQLGSGSADFYHGEAWAAAGAVFVTFNFRLGKLGFLAHPDLKDEDQNGVCGNYGLLDQVAALEWVRDNIAQFGGDPDCVTIFGSSSGASSVSLLMASPASRNLFHRAIAESGGSFGTVAETTGVGDRWQTMEAAVRSGKHWADAAGAPRLEDLRALDADRIVAPSLVSRQQGQGVFDASRPIVDGRTVVDGSYARFRAGLQSPVPLLVGSAANEDLATVNLAPDLSTFLAQARQEHGDAVDSYLSLYPAKDDVGAIVAGLKANGHRLFTWQNWTWARLHAQCGAQVYYYRFEQIPPVPSHRYAQQNLPRPLGAFHGASIFYSFNHFRLREDWPWSVGDRQLSATMISAWLHFARTGRPQAKGLPEWPSFDPMRPRVMAIRERPAMEEIPDLDRIHFWDRYYSV